MRRGRIEIGGGAVGSRTGASKGGVHNAKRIAARDLVYRIAGIAETNTISLLGFSRHPGWHGVSMNVGEKRSANGSSKNLKSNWEEMDMKRTVSILTAALFVSALAMPAFAQAPAASPAAAAPEASTAAPEASPAMAAPESAATEQKEEKAEHHRRHHVRHHHHHKAAAMSAPSPEAAPSTEAPAPAPAAS